VVIDGSSDLGGFVPGVTQLTAMREDGFAARWDSTTVLVSARLNQ
jgi:hypothetical protein